MAFFSHTAYPPHKHLSAARIVSPAAALSQLQTYLTATETQPHLRPDALFTEHAITTAVAGAAGGIVLHQLRRVEAGLRGERLAPAVDDDVGSLAGDGAAYEARLTSASHDDAAAASTNGASANGARTNGANVESEIPEIESDGAGPGPDGVVDASYNAQMEAQGAEGITEGEIGRRSNVVMDEAEIAGTKRKGEKEDKKARKARKVAEREARARIEDGVTPQDPDQLRRQQDASAKGGEEDEEEFQSAREELPAPKVEREKKKKSKKVKVEGSQSTDGGEKPRKKKKEKSNGVH